MLPIKDFLLDAAKSALSPLLKRAASLRAQKKIALAPEKFETIDANQLNDVFRILGVADPTDPLFVKMWAKAASAYLKPEYVKTESVKQWLSDSKVKEQLRQMIPYLLTEQEAPAKLRKELEKSFGLVARASPQEAAPVVRVVSVMLAGGIVANVEDTGTAAHVISGTKLTLERIDQLGEKLDARLELASSLHDDPLKPLDAQTQVMWSAAFSNASRVLLDWPTTLGDGSHFVRPEQRVLEELTQTNEFGTVAVLGGPGSGKSALLASFGRHFEATSQVPVLAIKGDILADHVKTEQDLQVELQLPALPSIMLRKFALQGPAVLLVDQLDALAGHIDIQTGRLSALLGLIRQVSNAKNVYIFVSCREFEFQHDMRLSTVTGESITLELPGWEAVTGILRRHGLEPTKWNNDAREVIRVPQHLNTYLQLKERGVVEPFDNYGAMLDKLWSMRVLEAPQANELVKLASDIAETMSEKEVLWISPARYDDRSKVLQALLATSLIVKNPHGAIGFSHQTVFEHVLARNFAKAQGALSKYVLARSESLFIRPKLWAALSYLRNVEMNAYEVELTTLWKSDGVHKHVQFLLIEFLCSQQTPTNHEQNLLLNALSSHELRVKVFKDVQGSKGWFTRLYRGPIAEAMSEERLRGICVGILVSAWTHSPDEVTNLLREIWLPLPNCDMSVLSVITEAPQWRPELLAMLQTISNRLAIPPVLIDHLTSTVGGTDPKIAIELNFAVLTAEWSRRKAQAIETLSKNQEVSRYDLVRPLRTFLESQVGWNSLPDLAAASPSHFLSVMWSWYVGAFQDYQDLTHTASPVVGYGMQHFPDFRFEEKGERGKNLPPLLSAIVVAVEEVVAANCSEVIAWAAAQEDIALAPVQRLVAHALSLEPTHTASIALQFLMADERRYYLGGISENMGTTLKLIAVCSPYWSSEELAAFASKVRKFSIARPAGLKPEGIANWHRVSRRTKVDLLRALPSSAHTLEVQRDLDEARLAVPARPFSKGVRIGGAIGSPMSSEQFSRASSRDILNAFKCLPDSTEWNHPKEFLLGGNVQLSREFATFAKSEPNRAFEIINEFEQSFGERAACYAIAAMAEDYDPDSLMTLIVRLVERGFGSEEFKQQIGLAVDTLHRRKAVIGEALLSLMEQWVKTSDFQPEEVETQSKDDSESLLLFDERLIIQPGAVSSLLVTIIEARMARAEVSHAIELLRFFMEHNRHARDWSYLCFHLSPIAEAETADSKNLIDDVLSFSQLDGSAGMANMIVGSFQHARDSIWKCLPRWFSSTDPSIRKGFGELVAFLSITTQDSLALQWIDALVDDAEQVEARWGAAASASRLFGRSSNWRERSTRLLIRLIPNNDENVWHEVFQLFHIADSIDPDLQTRRLVQCIAENIKRAPAPRDSYVVEKLGALLPDQAILVAEIATHLVQLWRDQLSDVRSPIIAAGPEMMNLAVTLHRTEGTRLQGLNMFEQLIELDAYQAREILDELDHRIRQVRRPVRARLKRRAKKPT